MLTLLCLALVCQMVVFAADPMFGTWKFNVEKSKAGNPAVWQGRTMIIESVDGNAYRRVTVTPREDSKSQRTEEIRYLREGKRATPSLAQAAMNLTWLAAIGLASGLRPRRLT
jgi:hypothetical protein